MASDIKEVEMQRIVGVAVALVCILTAQGMAQWTGGLAAYPGGYLLMTYRISTQDQSFTYTLELSPKDNGAYTIRTEIVGDANLEDIGDMSLFFVWQPTLWLADAWWLPYYFMIFGLGGPPEPNRTYVLPGGLSWETGDTVTIAGVQAVQGVLTSPSNPDEQVVLAISPDPAVPYPVLIQQERNEGGSWVTTCEMVLVHYEHRQ